MDRASAVREAISVLPKPIRFQLMSQSREEQGRWEEIRLRAGRGLFTADSSGRETRVSSGPQSVIVEEETLRQTLELATRASLQGLNEKLASGFLPLPGGHRLGICGTAAVREGRTISFRNLSSLNLRIACPVEGAGLEVLPRLVEAGKFQSTLILAPPGEGKTTLLRDLIRLLGREGIRTGLVDERGEVAALRGGVPQLDVGPLVDIMDGCSKGEGLTLLLRAMAPQVLAVDEITAPEDALALTQGANCGVHVLATAHGGSMEELRRRSLYRPLLEQKVFRRLVTISRRDGRRTYQVERMT